jgi:hypothetical protein
MSVGFTDDLAVVKSCPAIDYYAAESNAVYHEDREINGAMFRVSNAQYNYEDTTWTSMNHDLNAYAIVENTDGSINYLYVPSVINGGPEEWPMSTWQGQGQPEVYNALNYGLVASDSSAGAQNAAALTAAIQAVLEGSVLGGPPGGLILIPAGTYYVSGPISFSYSESNMDPGLIIAGVGGGTVLINDTSDDLFDFTMWNSGNGIRFRDLTLSFKTGDPSHLMGTAINVKACQNVTCERVQFINCPTAMSDDNYSNLCGLIDCYIYYAQGVGSVSMVVLSGSQDFIANCLIQLSNNGPTMCTGLIISSSTSYVRDTHISEFWTGIEIASGTQDAFFTNLRIDANSQAVVFNPGTDGNINGVFFSNCAFSLVEGSTQQTSGVQIMNVAGARIASIFFDNCVSYGWENAGIEIDAGQNIVITGGQYSSNGQKPEASRLGAGIAITSSSVSNVTISAVDCTGVYNLWAEKESPPPITQPCAIVISGGPSDVIVSGCNLKGNANGGIIVTGASGEVTTNIFISDCDVAGYEDYATAIAISGTLANVQVRDCPGYNDTVPQLSVILPSGWFSGSTFSYYGPTTFFVSGVGVSDVQLANNDLGTGYTDTKLSSGAFRLEPNEWVQVVVHIGEIVNFVIVGN